MFTGLPGGLLSPLLAAQAASFNKGQESQSTSSNARQEAAQKRDQFIFVTRQAKENQKTKNAEQGFLA
ncbi:MAG TPA: hypothetical protein V6C99_09420 [Oculatellaceae cyanobacterium]|jgi:hypothetical protein